MKSIITSFFLLFSVFVLTAQQNISDDNGQGYTPPENTSMFELDGLLMKPQTFLNLNVNARSMEKMHVDRNFTHREDDKMYVGKISVRTNLILVLDGEKLEGKDKAKKLSSLTEKKIASMNLLSEKISKEKYGTKDRKQVLVIDTKK